MSRAKPMRIAPLALGTLLIAISGLVPAERKYAPGVTDTEIKIGQTMPYSGPASAFGTVGRAQAAYFAMINEQGGINGRTIKLISLDDGYSPPRTVEQTRKLVEQEQVLLMFGSLGTATNTAVWRYLNAKRVPQLYIASASNKWNDPQHFPWSISFSVPPRIEAGVYASYLLDTNPDARIAVLYQNDDYGKDYLASLKQALGARASEMIVAAASYEITDPTVDSQVATLYGSGANVFMNMSTPKFGAMAIRKVFDIGWHPLHFVVAPASSVAAVLKPAGLEKSVGLISATAFKDPTDPAWTNDAGMQQWHAWMRRYFPDGDVADIYNVVGYGAAQVLVHALEQCQDDLSRENVMRQALSLKGLESPVLLPGVKIGTSASDYVPVQQLQLRRFDGRKWVRFGELVDLRGK